MVLGGEHVGRLASKKKTKSTCVLFLDHMKAPEMLASLYWAMSCGVSAVFTVLGGVATLIIT